MEQYSVMDVQIREIRGSATYGANHITAGSSLYD